MAKTQPIFIVESHGIYDTFKHSGKTLPSISKHTSLIPARVNIEFGLILSAKKAKGISIDWSIEHPNISDKNGHPMAPFEGNVIIRNNDWKFYLGDTIWAPEEDKVGIWLMSIRHQNTVVAQQAFDVTSEDLEDQAEQMFWKRRGF